MSSTNNGGSNGAAGASGAGTTRSPPRPHWRSRDPAATVVYVVHPAQFRDVVQQLTGATPIITAPSEARGCAAASCTTADASAAALEQRFNDGGAVDRGPDGDSSRATMTLKQMMEECMAWASSDGHDDNSGEGRGPCVTYVNEHGRR
jgi:hypothetical protein